MNWPQKLKDELAALALAVLYFGSWIGALVLIKQLVLSEYRIAFHGLSMALVGTLLLSKVVLVLEHVPLGTWGRPRSAWVDVLLRTALYGAGVFVALVLEKAFEGRSDDGGFSSALLSVFRRVDMPHVWANAICITGALLVYNAMSVVRRHLGKGGLLRLFLQPLPQDRGGGR